MFCHRGVQSRITTHQRPASYLLVKLGILEWEWLHSFRVAMGQHNFKVKCEKQMVMGTNCAFFSFSWDISNIPPPFQKHRDTVETVNENRTWWSANFKEPYISIVISYYSLSILSHSAFIFSGFLFSFASFMVFGINASAAYLTLQNRSLFLILPPELALGLQSRNSFALRWSLVCELLMLRVTYHHVRLMKLWQQICMFTPKHGWAEADVAYFKKLYKVTELHISSVCDPHGCCIWMLLVTTDITDDGFCGVQTEVRKQDHKTRLNIKKINQEHQTKSRS